MTRTSSFRLLAAFLSGAALVYFLDPARGRLRWHVLKDKMASRTRWFGRAGRRKAQDLGHRAQGVWAELWRGLHWRQPADDVLHDRVRSALGRVASHARAIRADLHAGHVILFGEAPAGEIDRIVSAIEDVSGVRSVENQLEADESPERHAPALHSDFVLRSRWTSDEAFSAPRTLVVYRPELAAIAATRVALGVGIGLLVAEHLTTNRRRNAGRSLLAFGALSTIPLAFSVFRHQRESMKSSHEKKSAYARIGVGVGAGREDR